MQNSNVSPQDAARELLRRRSIRRSLTEWARFCGFEPAKHHTLLIEALEAVAKGKITRLAVFMPPGSAKSTYASVLFAPWVMQMHPQFNLLAASHTTELADKWGRRIRNLIAEHSLALGISLSPDNQAAGRWALSSGGEYYAAGVGTGIAGFRANIGLIDDPIRSRQDADSELIRDRIWDWYINDFSTRLVPGSRQVLIQCMTADTPVTMADGSWKRLEHVSVGDEIRCYKDGKHVTRRVLNFSSQGHDEVFEIRTSHALVKANARHPFLVERHDGHREWVRVSDLASGDKIVMSRRDTLSVEPRVTTDEAWLLGYMLGDGWVTVRDTVQKGRGQYVTKSGEKRVYGENTYPRRGYVTCCALSACSEENLRVAGLFEKIFGCKPKVTKFGYIRTDRASVGRWFSDNGLNGTAKSKRVPAWMFSQPESIRESFLDGFNSADGAVISKGPSKGRWVFGSVNEDLIRDIRQVARGLGYAVSNVSIYRSMIRAPNSPAPVSSQNVNLQFNPWSRTDEEFAADQIRYIRPIGREEVFDVQIEDAECFLADGLVSHNTRWHEDDLAGRALQHDDWHVISLPAEAEENDPLGRKPGEWLWSDDDYGYGQQLSELKRTRPARTWSALYQQRPAPEEGDYFKSDWLRPYEKLPAIETLRVYGASDYAVTSNGGDYTVHGVVGVDPEGRMYLLDLWRKQASSDEWVESFCDLVCQWKPIEWAEEQGQIKAGIGPFLERRQRERSAWVARTVFPTRGDKAVRAQSIRGRMALNGLYVPIHAPWYAAFRSELLSFPAGKHDDQCLAEGTLVTMADGSRKPIECVQVGDYVLTHLGANRVLASGITNEAAEVYRVNFSDGSHIVATPNHPVFVVGKGFIPVSELGIIDQVETDLDSSGCAEAALKQMSSNTAGTGIAGIQIASMSTIGAITTALNLAADFCIAMFGRTSSVPYLQNMTSIISMETQQTIVSTISLASPSLATVASIQQQMSFAHLPRLDCSNTERRLLRGTEAQRGASGTESMARTCGLIERKSSDCANAVVRYSRQLLSALGFAPSLASSGSHCAVPTPEESGYRSAVDTKRTVKQLNVSVATGASSPSGLNTASSAPRRAVCVTGIEALSERVRVRNLTVKNAHTFFANGILTHNCDMLGLIGQLLDKILAGDAPQAPRNEDADSGYREYGEDDSSMEMMV